MKRKNLYFVSFMLLMMILLAGCVTETARITEYNDAGNIAKVTEIRQEDAIDKVMAEMAKKNIVIWKQGWYFVCEVTFTGTETYMPCFKLSGGKVNSGHLSIKDGCGSIPAIINVIQQPLTVDIASDGIAVAEKNLNEASDAATSATIH